MKKKLVLSNFLEKSNGRIWHYCPACDNIHGFAIEEPYKDNQRWRFDGNAISPSFSPSMKVMGGNQKGGTVCHYYLTDGVIKYLNDCTHDYAGKDVEIEPMPDRFKKISLNPMDNPFLKN